MDEFEILMENEPAESLEIFRIKPAIHTEIKRIILSVFIKQNIPDFSDEEIVI